MLSHFYHGQVIRGKGIGVSSVRGFLSRIFIGVGSYFEENLLRFLFGGAWSPTAAFLPPVNCFPFTVCVISRLLSVHLNVYILAIPFSCTAHQGAECAGHQKIAGGHIVNYMESLGEGCKTLPFSLLPLLSLWIVPVCKSAC